MKDVIIVIGMHRCGTSTISGILSLAGYKVGNNPQETDFFNQKGYFENIRFGIFNNDVLSALGGSWCDTLRIPQNTWYYPSANSFREQLQTIINEEFANESAILIKDPRISVLLPLYCEVFHRMSIIPRFIINFRDPLEVAVSLKMRNNLSMASSFAIWMDHLLKAERFTRNYPRVLLFYNDILKDPIASLQLVLRTFSGRSEINPELTHAVHSFVAPELKHNSRETLIPSEIPADVTALFDQLLLNRLSGTDPEFRRAMDEMYNRFLIAEHPFTGLYEKLEVMLQTVSKEKDRVLFLRPCTLGKNHFEFHVESSNPVKQLVFLPFDQRMRVRMKGFNISDDEAAEQFVPFSYSNATQKTPDDILIFNTVNPEIGYYFGKTRKIKQVSFDFEVLDSGNSLSQRLDYDGSVTKDKEGKNFTSMKGPVVIGGVGGSGTRLIAKLMQELNFYIGSDLNESLDNLSYTLLFKRPGWFLKNRHRKDMIERGLSVLEKTMISSGHFTPAEHLFLIKATYDLFVHGHNIYKHGSGLWAVERYRKILCSGHREPGHYNGWCWKEPNSHLLIDHLNDFFPHFKYIHTTRHGLDMAFSQNQQQLFNWGRLFGVAPPTDPDKVPELSFRYWVAVQRKILEKAVDLGPDRLLIINFDKLCKEPFTEISKLAAFLKIPADRITLKELSAIPQMPATQGRYHSKLTPWITAEDRRLLEELEFL